MGDSPLASYIISLLCGGLVVKLCLTLYNPVDYIVPGSSVHEVSQARIQEWVAISSCRGSSQPRDGTQVSCIAGGFFTDRVTREAHFRASLTKHRKQGGLSHRHLWSRCNGNHSSQITVLATLILSEGCEGASVPCISLLVSGVL